jgi:hypothetical protein
MAHLVPLAPRAAAESLRRLVLLDAGPYRLEEGGVGREFMFDAALETDEFGRKDYRQDQGGECARVLARYIPAAAITNGCGDARLGMKKRKLGIAKGIRAKRWAWNVFWRYVKHHFALCQIKISRQRRDK